MKAIYAADASRRYLAYAIRCHYRAAIIYTLSFTPAVVYATPIRLRPLFSPLIADYAFLLLFIIYAGHASLH